MNRRKRMILLVGKDDDAMAPLRFVLKHSYPTPYSVAYSVTSAWSAEQALRLLDKGSYGLTLVFHPFKGVGGLLDAAKAINKWMPVLVLTDVPPPEGQMYVHNVLYRPTYAQLLEKIKILTKQPKGPRKGSPSALRCGAWNRNRKKIVTGEYVRLEVAA